MSDKVSKPTAKRFRRAFQTAAACYIPTEDGQGIEPITPQHLAAAADEIERLQAENLELERIAYGERVSPLDIKWTDTSFGGGTTV